MKRIIVLKISNVVLSYLHRGRYLSFVYPLSPAACSEYFSLVRSILTYASTIWRPIFKYDILRLKRIQYIALRKIAYLDGSSIHRFSHEYSAVAQKYNVFYVFQQRSSHFTANNTCKIIPASSILSKYFFITLNVQSGNLSLNLINSLKLTLNV